MTWVHWLQLYWAFGMLVTVGFTYREWMPPMIRQTYAKVPQGPRTMATILYIALLAFGLVVIPLMLLGMAEGVVKHVRRRR